MSEEQSTGSADQARLSFVQIILIGLRVIPSEISWNVIRALRQWEINQLQKRLDREYQMLGRLTMGAEQSSQDEGSLEKETDLARKQIDFLQKEVAFLTGELKAVRQNILRKRRHKWAI